MTPLSRPLRQTTRKMMKKDKLGRPRNNNQNAGRNGLPRDDGDGGEELTAPSYLGEVGCAAWKQAATMMRSRGILDSSDALALEMCISESASLKSANKQAIKTDGGALWQRVVITKRSLVRCCSEAHAGDISWWSCKVLASCLVQGPQDLVAVWPVLSCPRL